MNKKRDFLFKIGRIILEKIFSASVLPLHFLNVVKLLLIERQYFSTIIEKNPVRVIAQDVTYSVFGAVINPFFDRYVLNFSLICFH